MDKLTQEQLDVMFHDMIKQEISKNINSLEHRITQGKYKSSASQVLCKTGKLTADFTIKEYGLIINKASKLPSGQRNAVVGLFEHSKASAHKRMVEALKKLEESSKRSPKKSKGTSKSKDIKKPKSKVLVTTQVKE